MLVHLQKGFMLVLVAINSPLKSLSPCPCDECQRILVSVNDLLVTEQVVSDNELLQYGRGVYTPTLNIHEERLREMTCILVIQ